MLGIQSPQVDAEPAPQSEPVVESQPEPVSEEPVEQPEAAYEAPASSSFGFMNA